MSESFFGRKATPVTEDAAVFKPRRFSDPVTELNDPIYDTARQLAAAVEMVDRMGIKILTVEADRLRNQRITVVYSHECDQLGGVETARRNGWSHWTANRHGVEITWCFNLEGVA